MDFRILFAKMDAAALIDSRELALLICTSERNITVMKCRGQLPATAFPDRKLNRWRVGTVRNWLLGGDAGRSEASDDPINSGRVPALPTDIVRADNVRRIGRPRKSVESTT